jgi:hypothetical protein
MYRIVALLGIVLCLTCGVSSAAPVDSRQRLQGKIEKSLQSDRWNEASKVFILSIWKDFLSAHERGIPKPENDPRSSIRGQMPKIESYRDYVGKFRRPSDKADSVFVEVVQSEDGRFSVVIDGRDFPAVACNGTLLFTTGDVVRSPLPQLGDKPYATLEMAQLVRFDDGFQFLAPGQAPSEKSGLVRIDG